MFVLIAWWELIRGNGWGWLWRVSDCEELVGGFTGDDGVGFLRDFLSGH